MVRQFVYRSRSLYFQQVNNFPQPSLQLHFAKRFASRGPGYHQQIPAKNKLPQPSSHHRKSQMLLNSPTQISPLEEWFLKNDSENGGSPTTLSLLSAFTRPTFVAAEQAKEPLKDPLVYLFTYPEDQHGIAPETPPLSSDWQQLSNYNTRASSTPIQEFTTPYTFVKPASPEPAATTTTSQWSDDRLLTRQMTKRDLDIALKRMCTEIDWDWFNDNYSTLNSTLENETSHAWIILASIYQAYIESLVGNVNMDEAWADEAMAKGMTNVMQFYRTVMHCMMCCFANESFEVMAHDKSLENYGPEDKNSLELFAKALVSGGEIEPFLEERAAVNGLIYPGGNGMFKERLRKSMTTKRNERNFQDE
ncbi:hypothetical protein B0J14DRAFT_563876 [Halenospora varia]|nr:hypothetical protein B0J14DRAFT_563876 [Halenospora varia]